MQSAPFVSVIVPSHNDHHFAKKCVEALAFSTYRPFEIIVVDDGSTNQNEYRSLPSAVRVVRLPVRSGPAAARNYGARHARGEVLLFIDADVLVRPETVAQVAARFEHDAELGAVFGSYDASPAEKDFVSQYKNLRHHFIHQQGRPDASTFWAGCGAVRPAVFAAAGGFDEQNYPEPSVEDIELGYRLIAAGKKISLDKRIQVKHLKRWKFRTLIYADVFRRAIPWTKLLLERRGARDDLNLRTREKLNAGLVGLFAAATVGGLFAPLFFVAAFVLLLAYLGMNRGWYLFLLGSRGLIFTLAALPLDLLYYSYCAAVFAFYWTRYQLTGTRSVSLKRELKTYK